MFIRFTTDGFIPSYGFSIKVKVVESSASAQSPWNPSSADCQLTTIQLTTNDFIEFDNNTILPECVLFNLTDVKDQVRHILCSYLFWELNGIMGHCN